jgi:hypothetical protein
LVVLVRRPSSIVHRRPGCPSVVLVLVASSSPSPSSSERDNQLAVTGDDNVFVRPRVALIVGRRGCCCAGTPLVSADGRYRKRPRTCARWWAKPPTRQDPLRRRRTVVYRCRHRPSPSSSIAQALPMTASSVVVVVRCLTALLMGPDAHGGVVSVGPGLDAAMDVPVLGGGHTTKPPVSHFHRRPSRSSSSKSKSKSSRSSESCFCSFLRPK